MVFGLNLGSVRGPKKAPAEPPAQEPAHGKGGSSGVKSALTVNEFVARTKRCREKGLEPTKPELIAYARYLGIDPIVDGDLMWIADEALNAPLPSEWTEHHDSADRVFYYNVQTHASSWTHPLEQLHRDTYKCIVNFRSGETPLSKEEKASELDKLRRKCEEAEREAHRELQAWSEHTDEQGQKFYYNREHQRSVWTDPRPSRCHALYLQMKALRVLSKQMGQTAPAPHRGLEPLGGSGAEHSGASDSDRSHREGFLPRSKKDKMAPLGGLDDTEGAGFSSGQVDISSWGNSSLDDEPSREERKRNKRSKKRDREGRSDIEAAPRPAQAGGLGAIAPISQHHDSPSRPGGLGALPDAGDASKGLFEMKKPTLADVQEVRQAIGMQGGGGGTRLPAMGGPLGHSNPFGSSNRLPSPPGDGLSTVGHVKVRAGIRLEPLKGGL